MRIATFHALVFLVGGSLGWWVAGLNSNDAEIVNSLRSDSSTATVEQANEMEGQQMATMPASSYSTKDVAINEARRRLPATVLFVPN